MEDDMTASKMRITKSRLDRLKIKSKEYFVWDTDLTGFGLRVKPTGKIVFIYQCRVGRKQRRIVIGNYKPFMPEQARSEAYQLAAKAARGEDPRVSSLKLITMTELCDLYLKEGCGHKKASTIYTDIGRIENHIRPQLGHYRVKDIQDFDIEKVRDDIANGKIKRRNTKFKKNGSKYAKGGKGTATRTLRMLGGIFTFAIKRKIIRDNPCRFVAKFPDKMRIRVLSIDEASRLAIAFNSPELNQRTVSAIKLLAVTGCRVGEIISLKWRYVNFEQGFLDLPDSKTGSKKIVIGDDAINLLEILYANEHSSEYIFPGRECSHISNPKGTWDKIRIKAGFSDFRMHDLRHNFASVIVRNGEGDRIGLAKSLLGHKDIKSTLVYTHFLDDKIKQTATEASSKVSDMLGFAKCQQTKEGEVDEREKNSTSLIQTVGERE